MRSRLLAVSLLLVAAIAGADSVADLVDRVSQNSATYRITVAEHELAMLQYESDVKTAETADELVAAELGRLSSLSSYQNALKSYYNDVIDAVFDMAIASLDLQAAEIGQEIAEIDLAYARARYDSGLIASSELTDAELAYREQSNNLAQAVFDEREARSELQSVTGLSWRTSLLPGQPRPAQVADQETWVESSISYQQAVLALSKAERAADNPAGTVSAYDQRSTEIDLEAATLDVQLAKEAAEREYRRTVRTLESDKVSLDIQLKRLALQQQLLTDADLRLERGLITESQRDQQRVRLLQADTSYLEALRRSIKNIVALLVQTSGPLGDL